MAKVEKHDCWLWKGHVNRDGYGQFQFDGGWRPAHRAAYAMFVGALISGLEIDHLCRNRRCVNPAHLEQVTRRVNSLRGVGFAARNARKTHCLNGHPLDRQNTLVYRGSRFCRPCRRERLRRFRARQKAKAAGI